jgi:uncharacterized membrane protein YphA (DoxX/SURF4 family)
MDPADLVDATADERLLSEPQANLPTSIGRPAPLPPPSAARKQIVGVGATLTGVTLVAGTALVVLGVVLLIVSGGLSAIAALLVGVILISTHWGWVHVAELTGNRIETRRSSGAIDLQRLWLEQIQPYTRYEVTTSVDEDGSIRIVRTRYEPEAAGPRRFIFGSRIELEEVHAADEPGATVTERAELLRREAAADTERERERFRIAADAYETALLDAGDERERQAARRAASEALSAQINENLREPPLVE